MAFIKLDDDLLARYDQMALEFHQPLPILLERQLARFADYPPTLRMVVLSRDTLQEVEKRLGGGQIQTPQHLLDRIRAYASVSLGKIELDFSPAQKEEILHRAEKRGLSPEAVVQELINLVLDQAFDAVTPYR